MLRQSRFAIAVALSLTLLACGGKDDDANKTGQTSLEVVAELQQSGVGGISQMPDGQLIIGYHPFFRRRRRRRWHC